MTPKQRGEIWAREFLGNDTWKLWKQDMDSLLEYRKSIKGKPEDWERFILESNATWIKFYNNILYSGATK